MAWKLTVLATFTVVIFANLSTPMKVQDGFYFDPAPLDQDVYDGESTKIRCDVSNRNSITFSWTMNNRLLANVSRRFQEGSDLKFLWVNRLLDNGSFNCIATNVTTGIALQSTAAKLNILWIDKKAEVQLKQPKEAFQVSEGVEILLRCQADGNEEPSYEWFRNKIKLTSNERLKIQKGKLKLINSTSSDNGIYSCSVKNSAGSLTSSSDFLLNIQGSNNVKLINESFKESVVVRTGDQAVLNCEYPQNTAIKLQWYHDKKLVQPSSKHSIYGNGSLVIGKVQEEDVGVYRCEAGFKDGGSQTFAVELQVPYLEEFTPASLIPQAQSAEPQVVPQGGRFSARCYPPKGFPRPTVKWLDPSGTEIEVNHNRLLHLTEGVISFANIETSSAGRYTCVANNMAGEVFQHIDLAVSVPSKIVTPPLSTRALEGESATFECKVTGNPYPITKIGWKLEEKILEENTKYSIDANRGMLTIKSVDAQDEGHYVCYTRTIGQVDVVSDNAYLYVERQLRFDPVPVDAYVELGQKDMTSCKAIGKSLPKVVWFREGKETLQDGARSSEGNLTFEKVQPSDAGRYSCYATNEQGSINVTISVRVVVKPRLKIKPSNTSGVEGSSVMLHCLAIGDPTPQIDWYKNGWTSELDKNRFKILSNGTLVLSTAFVEDSAMYGCVASSASGSVRDEAHLKVVAKSESDEEAINKDGQVDAQTTKIVAIVACVLVLGLLLAIAVLIILRRKHNRMKKEDAEKGTCLTKLENGNNHQQLSPEQVSLMNGREIATIPKGGSGAESSETRSHASGVSSQQSHVSNTLNSSLSLKSFDKYSFSRSLLHNIGRLGTGEFGEVVLAKAYNLTPGTVETIAMVKVLSSREDMHRKEFQENMELFSRTSHPYFARLLAICKDDDPLLAVFEYTDWGILKQLLEAARLGSADTLMTPMPTNEQKLNMCLQAAQGMDFLTSQLKLHHKDLATRNILISSNYTIKISNLGLTQDLYVNEYFTFQQQILPIRWMSPEALLENRRDTAASDVWSFGVYIWEVYTLASLPLSDKTNEMVIKSLKMDDVELPHPPRCPPEIWNLIIKCRHFDPTCRPSFSDLVLALSSLPSDVVV